MTRPSVAILVRSFIIRMKKLRAIYKGDVRFDSCPVFELNHRTDNFEMLKDKECFYSREAVYSDPDFILFEIEDNHAKMIKKKPL